MAREVHRPLQSPTTPRCPLRSSRPPRAVLALLALATSLPDAQAQSQLSFSGGALGAQLTYNLSAASGALFLLVPSLNEGPTPLALFDPGDPRTLDVGLDLLGLEKAGPLVGGVGQVTYPLPSVPGLQGLPLHAQFLTLPGTTTLVDQISNRASCVLSLPATPHFTLGQALASRRGHTATLLEDGRVLIAGGQHMDGSGQVLEILDSLEYYDAATGEFTSAGAALSVPRSGHSATLLGDGRVLMLGGWALDSNPVSSGSGELWDPSTNTTTPSAPMSRPRTQHTASLLADGRVLVAGGGELFDTDQILNSLASAHSDSELYDPTSDSWSPGPSLNERLIGHQASRLPSGRILIAGGIEVGNFFGVPLPAFTSTCYRYDPASNSFLDSASLPTPTVYHSLLTLADGRVLCSGGADGNLALLTFNSRSEVFRYSETSDAWATLASMNYPRAYHQLLETPDGRVIAVGGIAVPDLLSGGFGTPQKKIEELDPTHAGWSAKADMLRAREISLSRYLGDGARILTVGGWDDGSPGGAGDQSAELYIP